MSIQQVREHDPWPARAAMLAGAGALFGLAISQLFDEFRPEATANIWRGTAAVFLLTGGIVAAFTLERLRWTWSLAFAAAAGLVLAFVFYWNGGPNGWEGSEGWRFVSAALTLVIAAPLFQTIRDEGEARLPYPSVHVHAWTNIVLWVLACGFSLLVFLMMWLVAALFDLIGIDFVKYLMRQDWFMWMLAGSAFGGVMGLLRDRDQVLFVVQRVAMTILAVLAPILAASLLIFLFSLLFKGLSPLWETQSATSILLTCVAGAIILANAVIGNVPEEESKAKIMRWSAAALAGVILPLAVIAAVSTGKRIAQYGFTPSRLWALTFVTAATICGVAYAVSLIRGRGRWADGVRPTNVRLAVIICGIAFLLATPIVSFGAISTRDQVARLESGQIAPEKFDWTALRFDFGPSGIRALKRLQKEGTTASIRKEAAEALAATDRYSGDAPAVRVEQKAVESYAVHPRQTPLPENLNAAIAGAFYCPAGNRCYVYYEGGDIALAISQYDCPPAKADTPPDAPGCQPDVMTFLRSGGDWTRLDSLYEETRYKMPKDVVEKAVRGGNVEVRAVQRRQVFVGGAPVGRAFE
ncbi:DUF4153 domain-containing protein [Allosphingosinicella flava]|uniref:DUF4153 domain-containing protein n=1 Tax=Allosphingosinicella flava TaxID=2771430 RepID=A0A7T2LMR5_9SPHN|nr:DUF4153 domain-containing protein [Sphingosinicella flava]QPQ55538.1 DUF4153 domain-containing protein [Sphingosinicella flava]